MTLRHQYTAFLVLVLCAAAMGPLAAQESRWESDITAFEKSDTTNIPPEGAILFIGSSSIRMWKTLAEDMTPHAVINRGFGGSQIEDSIHFATRIIFPYSPRAIVLYAGDNDIAAGKTPETVFNDYLRFVGTVRAGLPDVPIYFISIKPSPSRWDMWPDMQAANRMIAHDCALRDGAVFLDCASPMLNADGSANIGLFIEDMLHMNAEGYALWTGVVKEVLEGVQSPF